ncbi:hypothetical protein [uncultured Shimia sp.]|uniref:hypothetical protein n=1 Tax=uncultured Shimia sp. TaxID=573152 RepID=UPI0026300D56|nr:hypothetical protein [uncultured Shimia sp.]
MTDSLDQRLLKAHASHDRAALVSLYTEAADQAQDETELGFFLTHAYVFALEINDARADALRQRLRHMGREQ